MIRLSFKLVTHQCIGCRLMDLLMKYGTQIPSPVSVLMVEDNEPDRAAIESALRRSEIAFKISVCEKAEDALDVISTNKESIDMVLVDYDLRGRSGIDLYRQLEHLENLPPFVMLINAGSENFTVEALQTGIYDCIIKDPGQGYLKLLPLKLADVKQRNKERKARTELKMTHGALEKSNAIRTAGSSQAIKALEKEVAEHQKAREQIRCIRTHFGDLLLMSTSSTASRDI